MGSAGHYSDRYFSPPDGSDQGADPDVSIGPFVATEEEVIALGATESRLPQTWRNRAWVAVAVVGATAAILVAVTDDKPAAPPPGDVSVLVASRAGIKTIDVGVTRSSAVLWRTRGYTYNVDLTNGTTTPLDVLDVTSSNSGTEIVWNQPLMLSVGGTAHLRVDFLVNNCAAVAVAPAPASLRLTLRPSGTSDIPGVAEISVADAGQTVDDSDVALCPVQAAGLPPLTIMPG